MPQFSNWLSYLERYLIGIRNIGRYYLKQILNLELSLLFSIYMHT